MSKSQLGKLRGTRLLMNEDAAELKLRMLACSVFRKVDGLNSRENKQLTRAHLHVRVKIRIRKQTEGQ